MGVTPGVIIFAVVITILDKTANFRVVKRDLEDIPQHSSPRCPALC